MFATKPSRKLKGASMVVAAPQYSVRRRTEPTRPAVPSSAASATAHNPAATTLATNIWRHERRRAHRGPQTATTPAVITAKASWRAGRQSSRPSSGGYGILIRPVATSGCTRTCPPTIRAPNAPRTPTLAITVDHRRRVNRSSGWAAAVLTSVLRTWSRRWMTPSSDQLVSSAAGSRTVGMETTDDQESHARHHPSRPE